MEYAALDGLEVDEAGFTEEMTAQKQRAREARKSGDSMQVQSETFHSITEPSVFTGTRLQAQKAACFI